MKIENLEKANKQCDDLKYINVILAHRADKNCSGIDYACLRNRLTKEEEKEFMELVLKWKATRQSIIESL